MKTIIPSLRFTLYPLFFLTANFISADTIITKENSILENQTIKAIHNDVITLQDSKTLKINEIKTIKFDRFLVAAKPSGIIMKDGTKLSGIMKEMGERIIFRSTSLGDIDLEPQEIAIVYYDPAFQTKTDIFPSVQDKSNKFFPGKIMWSDNKSTGVMTQEGLKKIERVNIACIHYSPLPAETEHKLLLRNGDIINLPTKFKADQVCFTIKDKEYQIPLKAVKTINF